MPASYPVTAIGGGVWRQHLDDLPLEYGGRTVPAPYEYGTATATPPLEALGFLGLAGIKNVDDTGRHIARIGHGRRSWPAMFRPSTPPATVNYAPAWRPPPLTHSPPGIVVSARVARSSCPLVCFAVAPAPPRGWKAGMAATTAARWAAYRRLRQVPPSTPRQRRQQSRLRLKTKLASVTPAPPMQKAPTSSTNTAFTPVPSAGAIHIAGGHRCPVYAM